MLNRPSPASVSELVPELEPLVEDEEQVWLGGPVQPNAVLVLGEFVDPETRRCRSSARSASRRSTTRKRSFRRQRGVESSPATRAGRRASSRTSSSREDWIIEEALNDDAFTENPEHLWSDVLRRKGGIYELVARIPDDPSVN